MKNLSPEEKSWESYYNHVRSTNPAKAKLYDTARTQAKIGEKLSHTYECFSKTGEWFTYKNYEDLKTKSNRPRNIFNPPNWVKAIGGHYNYILLKAFKKAFPHYVGNYNL